MFYLDPETQKRYTIGRPFSYGDINYTRDGATHATFIGLGSSMLSSARQTSSTLSAALMPTAATTPPLGTWIN